MSFNRHLNPCFSQAQKAGLGNDGARAPDVEGVERLRRADQPVVPLYHLQKMKGPGFWPICSQILSKLLRDVDIFSLTY